MEESNSVGFSLIDVMIITILAVVFSLIIIPKIVDRVSNTNKCIKITFTQEAEPKYLYRKASTMSRDGGCIVINKETFCGNIMAERVDCKAEEK